jgi:hypothetical protein
MNCIAQVAQPGRCLLLILLNSGELLTTTEEDADEYRYNRGDLLPLFKVKTPTKTSAENRSNLSCAVPKYSEAVRAGLGDVGGHMTLLREPVLRGSQFVRAS